MAMFVHFGEIGVPENVKLGSDGRYEIKNLINLPKTVELSISNLYVMGYDDCNCADVHIKEYFGGEIPLSKILEIPSILGEKGFVFGNEFEVVLESDLPPITDRKWKKWKKSLEKWKGKNYRRYGIKDWNDDKELKELKENISSFVSDYLNKESERIKSTKIS